MIILVLSISLLLQTVTANHGHTCKYYQFEEQPPSKLNCNPYFSSIVDIILSLNIPCRVNKVFDGPQESFDIRWFRRSLSGRITDLGRLDTESDGIHHIEIRLSLSSVLFSELSLAGDYWCQVINTTTQPHTYLGTSNVLRIPQREDINDDYDDKICIGTKRYDGQSCADYPNTTIVTALPPIIPSTSTVTILTAKTSSRLITSSTTVNTITSTSTQILAAGTIVDSKLITTLYTTHTSSPQATNGVVKGTNEVVFSNDITAESNSFNLQLLYPILISILLLVISLLMTIIAAVCLKCPKRKKKEMNSLPLEEINHPYTEPGVAAANGCAIARVPQPYTEPIKTLPLSIPKSERTTTRPNTMTSIITSSSVEAGNPLLNTSIYASLSTSTMEPQVEYAMVNASLKSDEFINYEYFLSNEQLSK